jgi:hypothetical protein
MRRFALEAPDGFVSNSVDTCAYLEVAIYGPKHACIDVMGVARR